MRQLIKIANKLRVAWRLDRALGLKVLAWTQLRHYRERQAYRRFLEKEHVTANRRSEILEELRQWKRRPSISVVLPVYNVSEHLLRRCIDSVVEQVYPDWELCVADDASTETHVRRTLEEYAAGCDRIKIVFREKNGHISAASNSALELVSSEFVVLLDHDDELSVDALYWVAKEIDKFPDVAIIYSDEDLINIRGGRYQPKFKPDFSRDLFYSLNMLTHLSAFRTEIVRSVGGFREGFEGSQDYDLCLRILERIDESQVRHIPRVLYHWRVVAGSVAFSMNEKPYAHERARQAIREHLARTARPADVLPSKHDLHLVRYRLPEPRPSVSVIVTGEDELSSALDAIGSEVIRLERSDRSLPAQLNRAVERCSGNLLIFLDSDLTPIDAAAIDDLIAFACQQDIGAVGGRILSPDRLVEQAGLVLASNLHPAWAHHGFSRSSSGNLLRNLYPANFSAVSVSCFAIARQKFVAAGGFEERFPTAFDVDLSLRLWQQRKRIVVVPSVEFMRSVRRRRNRVGDTELATLQQTWRGYRMADPFCNLNLKRDGSFEINA